MFRISPSLNINRPVGKFVRVEFGNPKKLDCAGVGICNVEMGGHLQPSYLSCCNDCKAIAHLSYSRRDNHIALQFRRADLTDKAYARHFASGVFFIMESLAVPPSIARACGLPLRAVFLQGRHEFKEQGGFLVLKIPNAPLAVRPATGLYLPQITLNF